MFWTAKTPVVMGGAAISVLQSSALASKSLSLYCGADWIHEALPRKVSLVRFDLFASSLGRDSPEDRCGCGDRCVARDVGHGDCFPGRRIADRDMSGSC